MNNEDQILAIVDDLLDVNLDRPGPTFRKIAERIVDERNQERRRILKFLKKHHDCSVDQLIARLRNNEHANGEPVVADV